MSFYELYSAGIPLLLPKVRIGVSEQLRRHSGFTRTAVVQGGLPLYFGGVGCWEPVFVVLQKVLD